MRRFSAISNTGLKIFSSMLASQATPCSPYAFSSSFLVYNPIISFSLPSFFPSLSFSFASFPSFPVPSRFLPLLFLFLPSSFLGNLSFSAKFLVAPLPSYFILLALIPDLLQNQPRNFSANLQMWIQNSIAFF